MSEYGFWNVAKANPEHVALVTPEERKIKAAELAAESNRLARGLRALGLGRGDVVATVLPNGAEMIELYLACFQSGLYLVPINHHLVGPEVAYIVSDSGARVFVGHERFAKACREAASEVGLPEDRCFAVGRIEGFKPYESLKEGQSADPPEDRSAGQVMNYTSGTTGRPKGVRRRLLDADPDTVGTMYAMFLSMFGIEPNNDNVHLCGSPLYHTAVLLFASNSLHYGHTVVLMDKWTPERCLQLIEKYRVTTSHMVPTQFHRLLALPEEVRKKYDLSSLRCMIHAAAPCPVDIKKRMLEWWGPVIYEYYAASEGGGTIVSPEEWLKYPGTVGRPWPGADIKIYDDEGNECPPGKPGTVYMLLGQADFEYHKDKKKTESSRRGNYFTVGDVGYLNEDGYLFLCDRKIDMIISGGVNIYPSEIEAVLLTHPKVADAAVFGIPHEDWGEEVKAVIEPAPGVEPSEELAQEILAYCEDKLAKYKRPKSIDFVAEMPRDPNGKLYKRKLRDPYWQGRERAI
ncbi:MAG: acyl-CoA synthetase [Candidatus Dadabacteria bacterium]|nr:MAG: acyl-CoA synthetase [Candidatus Dadabacteria bacterium]